MNQKIKKYIGTWENEDGNRLLIEREQGKIVVSFLAEKAAPVERPYANGEPSLKMPTTYNEDEYVIEVELWGKDKGYNLCLWHEPAYELDPERQEALVPGLSKYEADSFLNKYDYLFGTLKHYRRINEKKRRGNRKLPCLR